uniref:Lipoprotein n=4 Tax=unclassified Prevotella TaxID=2638335 RepID=A0AB33JEV0_9BACT
MKHSLFISKLLLLCIFISCRPIEDENHHHRITFYNSIASKLYVVEEINYPDTTVNHLYVLRQPEIYRVDPYSLNNEAISLHPHDTYEAAFKEYKGYKRIPSDTLMVFVFDAEKLEKKNPDAKIYFLARYDLSLEDLKHCNWVLTYPPTEAMKDVKMYPPYETFAKRDGTGKDSRP